MVCDGNNLNMSVVVIPRLELTHKNVSAAGHQRLRAMCRDQLALRQRNVSLLSNTNDKVLGDLGIAKAEPACGQFIFSSRTYTPQDQALCACPSAARAPSQQSSP